MSDLIRDAPIGQIIRYVTGNKYLQYPEERSDYVCPRSYDKTKAEEQIQAEKQRQLEQDQSLHRVGTNLHEEVVEPVEEVEAPLEPEEEVVRSSEDSDEGEAPGKDDALALAKTQTDASARTRRLSTVASGIERVGTRSALQKSHTQADLEHQFTVATLEKGPTRPIVPATLEDGTILVDWYNTDDQENPQNWSTKKKGLVAFII